MAEIVKIITDKKLDVLEAYLTDTEPQNPIDVVEGPFAGHVLFEIDSVTKELIKITIYDYSIVRRNLMREYIFLLTQHALKSWLNQIADSFRIGRQTSLVYT